MNPAHGISVDRLKRAARQRRIEACAPLWSFVAGAIAVVGLAAGALLIIEQIVKGH